MAARVRRLTTQARTDAIEYIHEETGYNYRLTNLQAALGVAQLEQLDGFVEAKRETAAHYRVALGGVPGVAVVTEAPWARSTYWMTSVLLDRRVCHDVRGLLRELNAGGVGARPLWRPLHLQPVYAGTQAYRIEVAERLYDSGLSLPCSVGIRVEERQQVAAALVAALEKRSST
jgi:dTDP-4-amino-4,6-dideoxygalactose transaminase